MNRDVKRIWHGFLTGVGFSVALIIILTVFYYVTGEESFGPESGLEITSIKEKQTDYGIELIGTVKNNGSSSWKYVYVGANFFDENGEFVDSFKESIDGVLRPGEEKHFKVSCGRKKRPLGEFSRYEAAVIDALYKS